MERERRPPNTDARKASDEEHSPHRPYQLPAGVSAHYTGAAAHFAEATAGAPSPLPHRGAMEESFGEDFSSVQAFVGQPRPLEGMDAAAAAGGERVAFASESPSKAVVAHELAHVVQHRRGAGAAALSAPGDAAEHEADGLAVHAAAGRPVKVEQPASAALHRLQRSDLDGLENSTATETIADNERTICTVRLTQRQYDELEARVRKRDGDKALMNIVEGFRQANINYIFVDDKEGPAPGKPAPGRGKDSPSDSKDPSGLKPLSDQPIGRSKSAKGGEILVFAAGPEVAITSDGSGGWRRLTDEEEKNYEGEEDKEAPAADAKSDDAGADAKRQPNLVQETLTGACFGGFAGAGLTLAGGLLMAIPTGGASLAAAMPAAATAFGMGMATGAGGVVASKVATKALEKIPEKRGRKGLTKALTNALVAAGVGFAKAGAPGAAWEGAKSLITSGATEGAGKVGGERAKQAVELIAPILEAKVDGANARSAAIQSSLRAGGKEAEARGVKGGELMGNVAAASHGMYEAGMELRRNQEEAKNDLDVTVDVGEGDNSRNAKSCLTHVAGGWDQRDENVMRERIKFAVDNPDGEIMLPNFSNAGQMGAKSTHEAVYCAVIAKDNGITPEQVKADPKMMAVFNRMSAVTDVRGFGTPLLHADPKVRSQHNKNISDGSGLTDPVGMGTTITSVGMKDDPTAEGADMGGLHPVLGLAGDEAKPNNFSSENIQRPEPKGLLDRLWAHGREKYPIRQDAVSDAVAKYDRGVKKQLVQVSLGLGSTPEAQRAYGKDFAMQFQADLAQKGIRARVTCKWVPQSGAPVVDVAPAPAPKAEIPKPAGLEKLVLQVTQLDKDAKEGEEDEDGT